MANPEGQPVDPRVQAAADRLRSAYDKLQAAQDPQVKAALRQEVMDTLSEATDITQASEDRHTVNNARSPRRFGN